MASFNPTRAFHRLRKHQGDRTAEIVAPLEDWLPAEMSYSRQYDRVEDAGGDPVTFSELEAVWTSTEIDVLDNVLDENRPDPILAGVLLAGGSGFFIEETNLARVKASWRIVYNEKTYVIRNAIQELALARCYLDPK